MNKKVTEVVDSWLADDILAAIVAAFPGITQYTMKTLNTDTVVYSVRDAMGVHHIHVSEVGPNTLAQLRAFARGFIAAQQVAA